MWLLVTFIERAGDYIAQEQIQYDVSLSNTERELQPGEGFGQSVPGFGAMFVMFTVFGGMATLLRERQNWTMQRVIVMPVTRSQVLGGKILTYFTLGMIQYSLLFGFGALMGLQIGQNLPAILLVMVIYTLSITALSFAIASSIRTEGQASNLTTLLSISLAALGVCMVVTGSCTVIYADHRAFIASGLGNGCLHHIDLPQWNIIGCVTTGGYFSGDKHLCSS